ncbi:hypothetical protein BRADI_1g66266v3 [Brachypodium distachyon]|uniref:ABC transmembrane type-1 domain-containing protein n=1 Tax=Brachypodium distachyon TaxID=15368 RepID=A0A2K2DTP2_BRADI|nr:hypothetical protein BRADI_1g66266v3 [Brachypodium distachyon]
MARLRLPQPRRQRNLAAAARVGAALVRASDALLRAYGPAPSSYAPAPPFSGQADHSAMAHARTRIRLCRRHRRPPCCRRAASRRGRSSPSARVGRPLSWRLHLHLPLLPSTKCSMKWLQEVFCWILTGEQQTGIVRSKYVQVMLNHDMSFSDTYGNNGDIRSQVSSQVLLILSAISEKLGNYKHNMGTFICGLIVGLINCWQIALLTLATGPLIVAT